jgi:hypothetical protein
MKEKTTVGNLTAQDTWQLVSIGRGVPRLLQARQMRLVTPRFGIMALFEGVRLYICVGRL